MSRTKIIVSTSINPPTEAIKKFDAMEDWHLIVAGDQKTPADYKLERGTYLSPNDQVKFDNRFSEALGWNTLARRNVGILLAYEMGAEVIALVDDDNIPYSHWGQNLKIGKRIRTSCYKPLSAPVFDPVGATNYPHLWHRGFPIQYIYRRSWLRALETVTPSIQADFWDGEPDVDAICRMIHGPLNCAFDSSYFPMTTRAFSPFNSQNTFMLREVISDYFLLPGVGRMDDIWASYVVEAKGHLPIYCAPSVFQRRNSHDLTVDFKAEIDGCLYTKTLLEMLPETPDSAAVSFAPAYAYEAWQRYRRHF